jgi:hypothetical protein
MRRSGSARNPSDRTGVLSDRTSSRPAPVRDWRPRQGIVEEQRRRRRPSYRRKPALCGRNTRVRAEGFNCDLREGPARRCLHRRASRLAADDLPRGARSRPCRGPGGAGDDQAQGSAVLRARGQHLRSARRQGSRERLYDGGIVPDPEGIIAGGQGNKTARTVAIRAGEEINARALKRVFEQIIANNRAGAWRKLKAQA